MVCEGLLIRMTGEGEAGAKGAAVGGTVKMRVGAIINVKIMPLHKYMKCVGKDSLFKI